LWVGTAEGLAAFDGHTFTTYDGAAIEGLSGNKIRALLEDREGTLWIGTPTGVSVRRRGEFRRIEGPSHIRNFGETRDGRVWMIGPSGLYHSTSTGVEHVSLPDTLDDVGVRADVVSTGTDSVWVATEGQLVLYHEDHFQNAEVRLGGQVHALDAGPNGQLWIGTSTEVLRVGQDTTVRYAHDGGVIYTIQADSSGTAWVGTTETGLLRVAEGTVRQMYPTSIPNGKVHSIERDRAGQWWVGTGRSGLVRLRPRLFWPVTEEAGIRLSAQGVYADTKGSVWVGSAIQNLCQFTDTSRTCYRPVDGLPAAQVHSVQEDGSGALWVSTRGGLVRRRDQQFEEVTMPGGGSFREAVLHRDRTGTLWIANQQGLFRSRTDTLERLLPASKMPVKVYSMHRGRRGAVWIGTRSQGVARYEEGRLRWFDGDDGVPYKNVRDIYETDDGTIWIGTYGGGIARFESDRFTAVTPADGLPAGTVNAIREAPDGIFWMTSNDGVFRISRSQVEAVADGRRNRLYAQILGPDDGMLARECNGTMHPAMTQDRQGRFWISTVKGAAVIDPQSQALAVPESVSVRVTAARADGTPHSLDSVRFSPSTYRIALDFTAVSLRHADDLSFRYRLDGESWTPARGRRTAEFTNLGADTHRFEVQATIDGETWHRLERPFRLVVAPHFYETGWFRLLVVLGLFALVGGAYRWRVYHLRRRQEALQTAVEERTRELAKEKEKTEQQAEKLAELDEAKNRFFAHISHEFRTPLSLILSPLEESIRRGAVLGPNQKQRMAGSARRLRRLIDQLLDLATLEAGRMELDRRPGDLASVVERVAEAFRSKAEQKDVALRLDMPEGRIETQFDPEKVETIVSNLVGNAVKFTPKGGTVTVRVETSDDTAAVEAPGTDAPTQGTVRMVVADTGPGIEPDVQEGIFDRFEQADNSPTRQHEGTGLGLALTSELVELHGGTIDVTSELGEGATFVVQLPVVPVAETSTEVWERRSAGGQGEGTEGDGRAEVASDVEGASSAEVASNAEAEPDGETATILIVEDNAEMRAYLREQLAVRWAVIEAADAEEGWETVQEEAPDLVLSDVMMPGTDGFELCRRIKDNETLRVTPVLLLTARADEEATREGLRCGADDYVAKPFDVAELRQRIANHLAARRHLQARYREEVDLGSVVVDEADRPFMERLLEVIDAHLSNPDLTVGQIADEMALSRRQLSRRVKEATGEPPGAFLR
ncbi:MAG TPA: two-component regulator propeller domain-containing protein, partial [Salinibacter sp.]|nr:two-component regulator propeller domain-containing protein [Salinibacter sp.]